MVGVRSGGPIGCIHGFIDYWNSECEGSISGSGEEFEGGVEEEVGKKEDGRRMARIEIDVRGVEFERFIFKPYIRHYAGYLLLHL